MIINNQEMQIIDDVVFANVMKDPATCKMLLKAILPQLDISEIDVHTQERIKDNPENKAAVLDIWIKDSKGRQYDIEMQIGKRRNMDLRARYYLSRLDTESLHSGDDYENLEAAYVIFLCAFDPKGRDFKEYKFKYHCEQDLELALDTKTEIIYLNSKGTKGEITSDLQGFFQLMNDEDAPQNKFTNKVEDRMKKYSKTPEWREHRMYIEAVRDKGKAEGKAKGIEESIIKTVEILRLDNKSDAEILSRLEKFYHDSHSSDELKQLIEKTK